MEWEKLCHLQEIQPATVYPLKVNIHIPSSCKFHSSSSRPLRLMPLWHQFEVWDLIIYTRSIGRWGSWSIVPQVQFLESFLSIFLSVSWRNRPFGPTLYPSQTQSSRKLIEITATHTPIQVNSNSQQFYNVAELGTCWEVWMRKFYFKTQ